MAKLRVRLNLGAIEQLKRSAQAKAAVHAAAEDAAANVRAQNISVGDRDGGPHEIPMPVEVQDGTGSGGLPSSHVVIAHPSGQAVQAKHGSLTKAAAQVGLKVRSGD